METKENKYSQTPIRLGDVETHSAICEGFKPGVIYRLKYPTRSVCFSMIPRRYLDMMRAYKKYKRRMKHYGRK